MGLRVYTRPFMTNFETVIGNPSCINKFLVVCSMSLRMIILWTRLKEEVPRGTRMIRLWVMKMGPRSRSVRLILVILLLLGHLVWL